MGTLDIIYLIIVGVSVGCGIIFAIKLACEVRQQSIKEFKQHQQKNKNKIKHGRQH